MRPGDRVTEPGRGSGILMDTYELIDDTGERYGRTSAAVLFDGDKIPTRGVWLDRLVPEAHADKETR